MTEMNGTWPVSSGGENMGACFTLQIPIAEESKIFSEKAKYNF